MRVKQKGGKKALMRNGARKIAAVFPTKEIIAECELKLLKLEAEDYFSFGCYHNTRSSLIKIRDIEIQLYGQQTKDVYDTEFELKGIWNTLDGDTKTRMKNEGPLSLLNAQIETADPAIYIGTQRKSYDPGLRCAKILMANAIVGLEGRHGDSGAKALILLNQAYEMRLKAFGPNSLLTLLAQRLYYLELVAQHGTDDTILASEAKRGLIQKLNCTLGETHPVCEGLEPALFIGILHSSTVGLIPETHNAGNKDLIDFINVTSELLDDGRPDLAHLYLEPKCIRIELEDHLEDEESQLVFLHMATVQKVLRRPADALVLIEKVYLQRIKDDGIDNEAAVTVKNSMDTLKVDPLQHDVARIAIARKLVNEAIAGGFDDATILRFRFRLAKTLLETFVHDEAFMLFMDVCLEQAKLLGYTHSDTTATLHVMCCHDLCRVFLKFQTMKALKDFFANICTALSVEVPKTDKLALKVRFFQAYIEGSVDDQALEESIRTMEVISELYYGIHGRETTDYELFEGKVAKLTEEDMFATCNEDMVESTDRYDFLLACDAARYWMDISWALHNPRKLKQIVRTVRTMYHRAWKSLRPNDPIILEILLTFWGSNVTLREVSGGNASWDITLLKDAWKRLERVLGPKHPVSVKALINYCFAESSLKPDETLETYEEAVRRAEEVLGIDHELTIRAKVSLATMLCRCKTKERKDQVKVLLTESTTTLKAIIDPYHPNSTFRNHCKKVDIILQLIGDKEGSEELRKKYAAEGDFACLKKLVDDSIMKLSPEASTRLARSLKYNKKNQKKVAATTT